MLYTPELTHVTFPICIRYSDTEGVSKHFDFIHKRTLYIHNLEKLFATRKIRLYEYAIVLNVKYKSSL